MKHYFLLITSCFISLALSSCASHSFLQTQSRQDLVKENWMSRMNTDPSTWTAGADHWFFTNEPNKFEDYASAAPAANAISAMMVRVPDFTSIKIDGPYRVQISGDNERNTVFILGSNDTVRHTKVEIHGDMLYIHPAEDCQSCRASLKEVIVRIGIRELHQLIAKGTGFIEGKHILSRSLTIQASDCPTILLAGSMNLTRVLQEGNGTISVIGANTPSLDVKVVGDGNVNLSGHVGVCNIQKRGKGTLNIVGADTDTLKINSRGTGIISIAGFINLKDINIFDSSKVYLYWVNSNGIYINLHNNSQLSIAGVTKNIDILAEGNTRFWGKFLRADTVYVKTRHTAHANVTPIQKLFATALDNSSIYFFGSPNVVSRYALDNALIIPVWCDTCPVPISSLPNSSAPIVTKISYKNERSYKDDSSSYKS